jgi:glycosyltransferase involved in cell wall biosynthesis
MPSTRFRVMPYLPGLRAQGARVDTVAMEPSCCPPGLKKPCKLSHYLRAFYLAWRCDLVFLQKPGFIINRWVYLKLLFRLQKKVIFDFDDAVFLDHETGLAQSQSWQEKFAFILARSRVVIAGNSYLAEFAKPVNPWVEVIPTPIDGEIYRPRKIRLPGQPVTIGWMGTASNLKYAFTLLPVMKALLAEIDARFLVVTGLSEKPLEFDFSDKIALKTWRAETEISDLQLFDIGIMPLADNAYSRGKCGFKLLQYMAVGIPVVASPIGMNCRIVEDGINGFLAKNEQEWLDKLQSLCADENLRQRLGRAGREFVLKEYSLRTFSRQWLSLLQKAALK